MLTHEEILRYLDDKEPVIKCSIDKLTVLGDDVGSFEQKINENPFDFIEGSSMAAHPYKKQFYCTDGSLLQWTDVANYKAIRYEFNPSKVQETKEREHRRAITQLLKTMKYPKVNRVDVAFDIYGIDLTKYKVLDSAGRKKNYWVDGVNRLETVYIGAPNADLRIRIYDKAKEQKWDIPIQWWRIEAQMRDVWCQPIFGTMQSGKNMIKVPPHLANPFTQLSLFVPAYKQLENINERAMVKLLLDDPDEFKNLAPATRSKYRKILASLPTDKEVNLETIFEENHEKLLQEVLYWVRIPLSNDVLEKAKNRKIDKRTKDELEESLKYLNPEVSDYGQDKEFIVESARMNLLYNT